MLIDFWASWCLPCRANNPELKRLYHQYKDKGLKLLSISIDTDADKWKAAIKTDGMDWLQDSEKQASNSFFKYAQIELKSNYFDWLLFPFTKYNLDKESISSEYFKELDAFSFNDIDAVGKTEFYLVVANRYNNSALNTIDNNNRLPHLFSSFQTAASHFKGIVRDRLMAWEIEDIIRLSNDSSKIDSVLAYFYKECKTPSLAAEVTAKIDAWGIRIKNTPAAFRELMDKALYNDLNGNEFSLSTLPIKKRWLLIDCWASWCGPCRENNPELKKLYDTYKRKALKVLGISVDTDASRWKAAIKEDRIDWPQASDLLGIENGIAFKYKIVAVPTYFLVAPDGSVEMASIGGDVQLIEPKLKEVLK